MRGTDGRSGGGPASRTICRARAPTRPRRTSVSLDMSSRNAVSKSDARATRPRSIADDPPSSRKNALLSCDRARTAESTINDTLGGGGGARMPSSLRAFWAIHRSTPPGCAGSGRCLRGARAMRPPWIARAGRRLGELDPRGRTPSSPRTRPVSTALADKPLADVTRCRRGSRAGVTIRRPSATSRVIEHRDGSQSGAARSRSRRPSRGQLRSRPHSSCGRGLSGLCDWHRGARSLDTRPTSGTRCGTAALVERCRR